jgi:hypothetical protein
MIAVGIRSVAGSLSVSLAAAAPAIRAPTARSLLMGTVPFTAVAAEG